MEETLGEEVGNYGGTEIAPALIAVHPNEESIVVAVGPELRVYDFKGDCPITLQDATDSPSHIDALRAICFGAKGRFFVSAGDDKRVKVWSTNSWHCMTTVYAEKRVSAAAFSHDGRFLTFADKFGVVWIASIEITEEGHVSHTKTATPLLGHYCSIITGLEFSPDGKLIASADRDFKIRVSVFPRCPLNGAYEIQSFCLGHTDFVSCITFICSSDSNKAFLISGSGDSTVRLWDPISGNLLDTCEIGLKVGRVGSSGDEEACHPAVTDLCASPDGSLVAVGVQSLRGVMLLSCDHHKENLLVIKTVTTSTIFTPTCLSMGHPTKQIWMVAGASDFSSENGPSVAKATGKPIVFVSIKVVSISENREVAIVLEGKGMAGGEKLLNCLQGEIGVGEEAALAAEAANAALRNLLIKRQYPVEKRELRKRNRNDNKVKKR